MSNLAVVSNSHSIAKNNELTRDKIDLIKRTCCKNSTDDELSMFIEQCNRTQLDPFARQIYAVKRWDTQSGKEIMSIQISIDGFRLIAERSGKYEGQTEPQWCGEDGQWLDVWLSNNPPKAARVGVYKKGFRDPIYGVAKFDSYASRKKDGSLIMMWAKMPEVMIAKCAESLALRKAFPQELSGLYTSDEMDQANSTTYTEKKINVIEATKTDIPEDDVPDFSTKDQIKKLQELATKRQLSESTISAWYTNKRSSTFDRMTQEEIQKAIDYLKSKEEVKENN